MGQLCTDTISEACSLFHRRVQPIVAGGEKVKVANIRERGRFKAEIAKQRAELQKEEVHYRVRVKLAKSAVNFRSGLPATLVLPRQQE